MNEVRIVRKAIDRDKGVRLFGYSLMLGMMSLVLIGIAGAQQSGGTSQFQVSEDIQIDMAFDEGKVIDFGGPDETHWVSGNPVYVTAVMEGNPVNLEAPSLTYKNREGVFSATHGVVIYDGTVTIKADQGNFNVIQKTAQFEEQVRMDHKDGGWMECDVLVFKMGENGIDEIHSEGKCKVGRINIFRDNQLSDSILPIGNTSVPDDKKSQGKEALIPEAGQASAPEVKRAMAPLEQ